MKNVLIWIVTLISLCNVAVAEDFAEFDLSPIELDLSLFEEDEQASGAMFVMGIEKNEYELFDAFHEYNTIKYSGTSSEKILSEKFYTAQDRDETLETDKIGLHFGSLKLGGNLSANYLDPDGRSTTKIFSEYTYNRFKLSTELAKADNIRNNNYTGRIGIEPEIFITDSFSLSYILKQNLTDESHQGGFGVSYKPRLFGQNVEFSADIVNRYKPAQEPTHRLNIETTFRL